MNTKTQIHNFEKLSLEKKCDVLLSMREEIITSSKAFKLTEMQEAFYISKHFSGSGDNVGCHIYIEFDVNGLDVVRLERAWELLLSRHPMLRTKILTAESQVIPTELPKVKFDVYDLSSALHSQISIHINHLREQWQQKVYQANDWPYYRILVTHLPTAKSVIHLSIDEWIADGASLAILLRDWQAAYESGEAQASEVMSLSFAEYLASAEALLTDGRKQADLTYWLDKMKHLPAGPQIGKNQMLMSGSSIKRCRKTLVLEEKSWNRIKQLLAKDNISPTVLLLVVFTQALRRHVEKPSFSLILTQSNRLPIEPGVMSSVGPYLSTSLFKSDPSDRCWREELIAVQQEIWQDLDHASISGVQIIQELRQRKEVSLNTVLPVVFTSLLSNIRVDSSIETNWLNSVHYSVTQTPQVYLDHQVMEANGELRLNWDYAAGYYQMDQLQVIWEDYFTMLNDLASDEAAWFLPANQSKILQSTSEVFPLTEIQQAYLVGRSALVSDDDVGCVVYQEIDFERVTPAAIQSALQTLVNQNEALRTVFSIDGTQRVLAQWLLNTDVVDCSHLRSTELHEKLQIVRSRLSTSKFEFNDQPLVAATVSDLGENRCRLHLVIDMLVADGNSIQILIASLIKRLQEGATSLSSPNYRFRDYIQYREGLRGTTQYNAAKIYWEQRIDQLYPAPIHLRRKQPTQNSFCRKRWAGSLVGWSRLSAVADMWGVQPSTLLLTAYADALLCWNRNQPLSLVVVNWDRPPVHPDIDSVIGDFTSVIWLQVAPSEESFQNRAQGYQQQIQQDLSHSEVSGLSALRRKAIRHRNDSRYEFSVVFTDMMSNAITQLPAGVKLGYGISRTPQVTLDNISYVLDDELHFHWDVDTGAHNAETVTPYFESYRQQLSELMGVSDQTEIDMSLLEQPLHYFVEQAAKRFSKRPAVRFMGQEINYEALERRAETIAAYLRSHNVSPDEPVAVFMDRSIDLVVTLLGILKAGAAYLPLDTTFPESRSRFILEDASVRYLVAHDSSPDSLHSLPCAVIRYESIPSAVLAQTLPPAPTSVSADKLAYILYTSGSTGKPKGCMLPHRAVVNRILWMRDHYAVDEQQIILQKTPYTFDVSVWEFFLPLICGATLVMAKPKAHKDPSYLTGLIQKEGVTICHFVPSMLNAFLNEESASACKSLQKVFTSGEALPYQTFRRFNQQVGCELHNLYGPTEAAIDVTYWSCEENHEMRTLIGKPVANTQIHILDGNLEAVAEGEEGELYIGGVQLARGYLNRDELTAQAFISDPFSTIPGARLYRTGDLARHLPDGNIDYVGRADFQVKLRGLRIELGEIECHLNEHPDVVESAVLVKDEEVDDPKLVAYIVTHSKQILDLKTIRQFLRSHLPEYMLPNAIITLASMPVTTHGKLDRKALPWGDQPSKETIDMEPSQKNGVELEQIMARVKSYFKDRLSIDTLDVDEDLFDLGLTSLKMVQIAQLVKAKENIAIPVEAFLDDPTVKGVALYLKNQIAQTPSSVVQMSTESEQSHTTGLLRSEVSTIISLSPVSIDPMPPKVTSLRPQEPLSFAAFSGFLGLLQAHKDQNEIRYRYASAGGKYAVQTYVYVKDAGVTGVASGMYYYQPLKHSLYRIEGTEENQFFDSLNQDAKQCLEKGRFLVFLVAQYRAIKPFYHEASHSLVELDCGYMLQLLEEWQADFGLTTTLVPFFDRLPLASLLQLDGDHRYLNTFVIGEAVTDASTALQHDYRNLPFRSMSEFIDANSADSFSSSNTVVVSNADGLRFRDENTLGPNQPLLKADFPASDINLRSCQRTYESAAITQRQLEQLFAMVRVQLAGASLLLNIYIYIKPGSSLVAGLYKLNVNQMQLILVEPDSRDLAEGFKRAQTPFNRNHVVASDFILLFSLSISEGFELFGNNALRLAQLEAGRIGQHLLYHQSEIGLGLCPIGGMRLTKLPKVFNGEGEELYVHSIVGGVKHFQGQISKPLLTSHPVIAPVASCDAPMAIVGWSGRFANVTTAEDYWQLLCRGNSAIRPVHQVKRKGASADPVGNKYAGLLENVASFDSLFFKMSPMEAKVIDPQERLFLEVAWECLENAGYTPDTLRASAARIGVFVGAMWSDYQNHGVTARATGRQDFAISFHSSIANRVSHFFNFQGPSVAFDTSCSSAATAIHYAIQSLRNGDCDAAIIGGVNLITHDYHREVLAGLDLVSVNERSAAFSEEGTGWVPGEGVSAILIRPLPEAELERDHIHGVIRASSIGHTGRTARFGLPTAEAYKASMNSCLKKAGISSSQINYVESAATGAALSDATEVNALAELLASPKRDSACPVGSVKPNIGHLESASFLSQLAKVLLQMRYGQIAPSRDSNPRNPLIDSNPDVLYINESLRDWTAELNQRRCALINTFGATGSSGHLIVQEYPIVPVNESAAAEQVFVLSAGSKEQLRIYTERMIDYLTLAMEDNALRFINLTNLCFTLQQGRVSMPHRLALVAKSLQELRELLDQWRAEQDSASIFTGEVLSNPVFEPIQSATDAAKQWVSGVDVCWSQWQFPTARRVPLPTYPFNQEDHWIESRVAQPKIKAKQNKELLMDHAKPAPDALTNRALNYFLDMYSEFAELDRHRIKPDVEMIDYGINSLLIKRINAEIDMHFTGVSKTVLFECRTLRDLTEYFCRNHRDELIQLVASEQQGHETYVAEESLSAAAYPGNDPAINSSHLPTNSLGDIAIIGLSGRYPQADSIEEFWQALSQGKDCIETVPISRWDTTRFPNKNTWGGFLRGVDEFDPLFFNISPSEAKIMDPQERLFLQTAWEAVEDAGYTRGAWQASGNNKIGVYVGVMYGEYQLLASEALANGQPVALGSAYGSIANRVSYLLNLTGPSMAVDTLCSSSLTAMHLAVQSLHQGECQQAIVGGVNLSIHPSKYVMHAQMNMPSSDGRCRSFGEGGDGFVPGEGVGAVLLKPYQKAVADGDHVYGVIKGTAVNHDGKTNGYTVPNPVAQGELVRSALARAGIEPAHISYIEAHGTGTSLGDPIEVSGLEKAFTHVDPAWRCAIGSVKSNIGHLEAAAGMAALTKVLLQMKNQQLAPSLHADTLNTNIDFATNPFFVQRTLGDWQSPLNEGGEILPRIAGISSFGAGGGNAHIIVAEPPLVANTETSNNNGPYIFILSAKNLERLQAYGKRWLAYLEQHLGNGTLPALDSLVYTAQVGRESYDERFAVVVNNVEELVHHVRQFLETDNHKSAYRGNVKNRDNDTIELISGDEADEIISVFIRHRSLDKLARLWVNGCDIGWQKLYLNLPKRVSIPTYPFAQNRYWPEFSVLQENMPVNIKPIKPKLFDENVSDLHCFAFKKSLNMKSGEVIVDSVSNELLLGGGQALNWVYGAAHRISGHKSPGLKVANITLSQPRFAPDANLEITTELYQSPDKELLEVASYANDGNSDNRAITFATVSLQQGERFEQYVDVVQLKSGLVSSPDSLPKFKTDQSESCYIESVLVGKNRVLLEFHFDSIEGDDYATLMPNMLFQQVEQAMALLAGAPVLVESIASLQVDQVVSGNGYLIVENIVSDDDIAQFRLRISDRIGRSTITFDQIQVRLLGTHQVVDSSLDLAQMFYKTSAWIEKPLAFERLGTARNALVIDNDRKLWDELVAANVIAHQTSVRVSIGQEPRCIEEGHYEFNPGVETQMTWFFDQLHASGIALNAVIHNQSKQSFSNVDIVTQLDSSLFSLFSWCQAFIQSKPRQTLDFIYLYHSTPDDGQPFYQACSSFLRSVAFESTKLTFQCIGLEDTDLNQSVPLVDALADALQNRSDNAQHIKYHGQTRMIQTLIPVAYPTRLGAEADLEAPIRANANYLITGGGGGLGLIFAKMVVDSGAHAILCGRSSLSAHDNKALQHRLTGPGRYTYLECDITQSDQVRLMFETIEQEQGPLSGVIHAAGILKDEVLVHKQRAQSEKVLAPKVQGTLNLHQVLADRPLDFFVLCSSIVGVMGNVGQSDYAFANSFLDGFASYRNRQAAAGHCRGKTISINWPFWNDGGMQATEQSLALMREYYGLVPLSTDAGKKAFFDSLILGFEQLIVVAGYPEIVDQRLGLKSAPEKHPFDRLRYRHPVSVFNSCPPTRKESNEQKEEKFTNMFNFLTETIGDVLGVSPKTIDSDLEFWELGLDSILSMKVIESIESQYNLRLYPNEMMEYNTIAKLQAYLSREIGAQVQADSPPASMSEIELVHTTPISSYLRQSVANVLDMPVTEVNSDTEFWELGLDSILAMKVIESIEAEFSIRLYPNEMLEYNTITKLSGYLEAEVSQNDLVVKARESSDSIQAKIEVMIESQQTVASKPEPQSISKTCENAAGKKVIFVLSTPRAGSTLLRVMLQGHSEIFSPPELHLLPYSTMNDWSKTLDNLNQKHIKEGLTIALAQLENLSIEQAIAEVERMCVGNTSVREVYDRMLTRTYGRYLVDKSPNSALSINTLQNAELVADEPFYIHLVRNPISVMESFVRNRFDKLFAVEGDPWRFAEHMWGDMNANIISALHEIPKSRQMLIRYEDLVEDSVQVMTDVCSKIGLPFEQSLLTPYQGERMTGGLHQGSMPIGDPNFDRYKKIDTSLANGWQAHIDKAKGMEVRTIFLAKQYGYSFKSSTERPNKKVPEKIISSSSEAELQ